MFINNMAKLCKLKKIANFCETKYFVVGKELFTISLIPIWREIVSMFCRVNRQGVKRVMRVKRVILRHARSFFSDYSAPTTGSGSLFTKRGVHNNHTSVPSMVPSTPHLSLYPPSSPCGGGGGGGAERKHEDKKVEEKFVYSLGLSFCKILCIYCSVQEDTFVSLQCLNSLLHDLA